MEKVFEIYIKHDAGAALGGDHRPGDRGQVQLRRRSPLRLDARARRSRWPTRRPAWSSATGEVLEVDPPRRLVHTMTALWSDDVKSEGASRVTWEIEPVGDSCRLTVTHDQLRDGANERALRRLADDPLRPEDVARDRRAADDPRLAHVHLRGERSGGDGVLVDDAVKQPETVLAGQAVDAAVDPVDRRPALFVAEEVAYEERHLRGRHDAGADGSPEAGERLSGQPPGRAAGGQPAARPRRRRSRCAGPPAS